MNDIIILVAADRESVEALASQKHYRILYIRSFGTLNTDTEPPAVYGHIQSRDAGVVAIART